MDDRLLTLLLNRKLAEAGTLRKGFVLDIPLYVQQLKKEKEYRE